MRTDFSDDFLATRQGQRANEIIRSCVHCGFCNATCPTYQVTGDELDGPRGRIYLIRDLLEHGENKERATLHLDRCLTCRACETTFPSGVAYGELAEIARHELGPSRKGVDRWLRRLLLWMVPEAGRLRAMARLGRWFRLFLPSALAKQLPAAFGQPQGTSDQLEQQVRKVILLNGCAQQVSTPQTNLHLAELLASHDIGVQTLPEEACCGSLDLHLGNEATALQRVRQNVDALSPLLDDAEAIVSTATGCGVTIKDYGRLLADDPDYAERAAALSSKTVDVAEYLSTAGLTLQAARDVRRVAWHAPCSLTHGQQVANVVEQLLTAAGYDLVPVADPHLCCGSAGTYSLLQPKMSGVLLQNKLAALTHHQPEIIATANVGCQTHLGSASNIPIVHWIELVK
ncbi:MAG: glycolate oxidase subunit GlcF [Pseudomonadota bacterium]